MQLCNNAALQLFQNVAHRLGEASLFQSLGLLEIQKGEIEKAKRWQTRAIELHHLVGSRLGEANDWGNFAIALFNRGKKDKAREYASRAEPLYRSIGSSSADKMRQIMES